jgi:hypothetical protein
MVIERQREKAELIAKKAEYKISREMEILEHKHSLAQQLNQMREQQELEQQVRHEILL